ncbi:MAG: hypothetical protein LBI65_02220, partial [Candidatus Symbiothrix sp.]|nr:hypothetical protein [Candidatus Symbiothrix sp.]
MKKNAFLFSLALLFAGCEYEAGQTVTYSTNEPVFMPAAEFRNSVTVTNNAHELGNYGKICFYEGYLYISEPGKGIHIINNTNPSQPRITGYIELLGNFDLTARNGVLYADAFVDLVWFDISDPSGPQLKGRLENVFPEVLPAIENEYGYDYSLCYPNGEKSNDIIVGWELKQHTENYKGHYEWWWNNEEKSAMMSDAGNTGNGATGSMSRFGLYENYLYTVINNQMNIFDLSGNIPQKAGESLYIGNNVETIFNYTDKMFLGTPTGLMIYSLEDPLCPLYRSNVWHIYGCDPVVVEDDLAYVTIHSGNFCGQENNELFIMDVSNVDKPKQLASYTMKNPRGLGIEEGTLFL